MKMRTFGAVMGLLTSLSPVLAFAVSDDPGQAPGQQQDQGQLAEVIVTGKRSKLADLSGPCEAMAEYYFQEVSGDEKLGARQWHLARLKKDLNKDPGNQCLIFIMAHALEEEKAYWDHISTKYKCDKPTDDTQKKCDAVAMSENWIRGMATKGIYSAYFIYKLGLNCPPPSNSAETPAITQAHNNADAIVGHLVQSAKEEELMEANIKKGIRIAQDLAATNDCAKLKEIASRELVPFEKCKSDECKGMNANLTATYLKKWTDNSCTGN